jgi:hypothetical protein
MKLKTRSDLPSKDAIQQITLARLPNLNQICSVISKLLTSLLH